MHRIEAHKGRVCALAYSPDGRHLASGGEDRKVRLWDTATWQEAAVFKGHKGCVYALAFSPDNTLLASGGGRNELFLWSLGSHTHTRISGHSQMVAGVAFSPDGRTLVRAAGEVHRYYSEDGQVVVWDVDTRSPRAVRPVRHGAWAVAYDPDGLTLAVATGGQRVELWDPGTGGTVGLDTAPEARSVAFSPDGSTLAAAMGTDVRVWAVRTRALRYAIYGHLNVVWSVAYTRDGRGLMTAGEEGAVKVWDAASGAEVGAYDWGIGKARSLAVAPDGLTAAAGGDGVIAIWDVE